MKAADYIAEFLADQGVTHVFEVVGGMITHMIDAIHQQGRIQLVSVHHEQAASFAADAMGRLTGIPGVAMATSGPGATNLLTGIGSCYFDSAPAVFITGQVNLHEQKKDRPIRQLGFQETDIVPMAKPITKAAWRLETIEDLPRMLTEAFELATSGRPGPVLIDIPMDLQRADITPPPHRPTEMEKPHFSNDDTSVIQDCLTAIQNAKRPLILAGGGIHAPGCQAQFRSLVERLHIPVIHSLMAVDALPYTDPLRVGMLGSYGNRWANLALGESDFILVLGSRLDIRQTGADVEGFRGQRTIYHVDCERGEINNRVPHCVPVLSELSDFFKTALPLAKTMIFPQHENWLSKIEALRQAWPDTAELSDAVGINPNTFMHELSRQATDAAAYVVDVGQHQMWAAQSLELTPNQHFMTSGGMGAMGFALPAAIGVAMACPNQPVIMIAGDGSFQLNLQELQTVSRNRLPIKMVIINNLCHGMVRQFQESYFDGRYASTLWGYSAPDFAELAKAYGIAATTVSEPTDTHAALASFWADPTEPYLLQVMVDTMTNVYPKIAFGHPITEMEPYAQPLGMEGT